VKAAISAAKMMELKTMAETKEAVDADLACDWVLASDLFVG
jgi:hypothetical protein